ncbi:hypothetical protein AD948_02940 [Acetobacter senegalensis]|uniref:Uncharacterized protein n=1 Tax=Acetobacter senegalensis TaxID=446692 RepID=A0A149U6H3_9PROT|nr:hypothetical protein AD948_02940 [Acetobacter senegalensis]
MEASFVHHPMPSFDVLRHVSKTRCRFLSFSREKKRGANLMAVILITPAHWVCFWRVHSP